MISKDIYLLSEMVDISHCAARSWLRILFVTVFTFWVGIGSEVGMEGWV